MKWMSILLVLLMSIVVMNAVHAQIVDITEVEFDDDELQESSTTVVRDIERGEEVEVKVHFTALVDMEEVEIEARITGVGDDDLDIRATAYVDEIYNGTEYVKKLMLDMPYEIEQGEYLLKVRVDGPNSETESTYYSLLIEAVEDAFIIKDVTFSPGLEIEAGRALLTTVRVENIGDEDDADGVKVEVSVSELGLKASDYLDEVDEDDSISSEELLLRIPASTKPGDYQLTVTVYFDDGDKKASETYTLTVVCESDDSGSVCSQSSSKDDDEPAQPETSKTVITVGPQQQDMTAGQGGAVYPITLTNAAGSAKTYVVSVAGYENWADVRMDPSNVVVLSAGETQTVYLFASANEGVSGLQSLVVSVASGSETLKEFVLRANVKPGETVQDTTAATEEAGNWDSVKRGLEIGLIVLVVLLVILGLIIAVNKIRGNDDDSEDEGSEQTYY